MPLRADIEWLTWRWLPWRVGVLRIGGPEFVTGDPEYHAVATVVGWRWPWGGMVTVKGFKGDQTFAKLDWHAQGFCYARAGFTAFRYERHRRNGKIHWHIGRLDAYLAALKSEERGRVAA